MKKSMFEKLTRFFTRSTDSKENNLSDRVLAIRDSNIRDAARLVKEIEGVVNLGQGLPEASALDILKQAASSALANDYNQYSNTWGYIELREAISRKLLKYNGIKACPETEITVTCGASEAINAALLAIINPKDEVIIFEPFYENYHPNVLMAGGVAKYVRLKAPDWNFDRQELTQAFNSKTKAIIINTPHNPTGKVFSYEELEFIANLCKQHNVIAITDEIYEYMVYDGLKHISLATLPGMKDLVITVSGLSKTFSVTGWRLGYVVANSKISSAIRKIHDYLTLCAPSPMQIAAITALNLPDSFYENMRIKYQALRDQMMEIAQSAGFKFKKPNGTYYLFTDCSQFGYENDRKLWEKLLYHCGLATVSGYCFYRPNTKTQNIRFCYAKSAQTLEEARKRLAKLK